MFEDRVATTLELKEMIQFALDNRLNRTPTANLVSNLDPSGKHILIFLMFHEHAGGVGIFPHARCQVLAKLIGKTEPAHFILDTDTEMFENLPSADVIANLLVMHSTMQMERSLSDAVEAKQENPQT